ncbi:MAG: DUF4428 domain-containing protein [Ruminococcaceae bacterium]|nr:DUF4428 domain-containing protein [Oscillospiraceae bacterium]
MGLFDKKFCDICGEKIGLLGNRKLVDGNMCKDCARKLSPFFSDRRSSTVDEIKQQLSYREQNRQLLRSFTPDRVFGEEKKFFIDSMKGAFVVSRRGQNDWDEENPDIIPISSVNSCNLRIDQDEEEQYYENANGESVSYNPPRYIYSYTFVLEFNVNNPFFDDFEVTLNNTEVEPNTQEYMNLQQLAMNIMSAVAPGKFTAPAMNGIYNQPQGNMYQGGSFMNGYPQNQGYGFGGAPATGQNPYQQPPMNGFNQPMNGFNQPMNGFNQPVNGFNQPMNGFNQPANGFNQPANGFNGSQGSFASQQTAQGGWFCQNCGTKNTGNFCCNCGATRNN